MESNQALCFEAGMDDFVTKPIQPQELFQAIQRHLSALSETDKIGTATVTPPQKEKVLKTAGGFARPIDNRITSIERKSRMPHIQGVQG
jgi:DNA-binding response OmpR family regulator